MAYYLIHLLRGPSWSWSYGSWTCNYLWNQCLSALTLWVWIPLRRGILATTLCDKVCQRITTGRWFSPGTLFFSSTNKTDRHYITEILIKVTLNTIALTNLLLNTIDDLDDLLILPVHNKCSPWNETLNLLVRIKFLNLFVYSSEYEIVNFFTGHSVWWTKMIHQTEWTFTRPKENRNFFNISLLMAGQPV